jgi:hypothetical protein
MNVLARCFRTLIAAAVACSAVSATAQPVNNDCSGATPVSEGLFTFDLTGATNSVNGSCDTGGEGVGPDIWYRYTAGGTGNAIVTTCGLVESLFTTNLTVFAACAGPELACNSNACGEGQSTLNFPVLAGHTYLVRVASGDDRTPSGQFRITLVPQCTAPAPGAPANDCCSTATPVGNGAAAFTTVGATRDYAGPCDQTNPNPDVWFNYTAPTTGYSKVRPRSDAPADLGITILQGSCGGLQTACGADLVWVGDVRQVVFPVVAGQHYLIRLHGVSDPVASGHIVISTALPPVNDECITATPITGTGTFPYDNTLANDSGPDDAPACDTPFGGAAIAKDVWFLWTSNLPVGQDAVVSTCGQTRVDTRMAVYTGTCPVGLPLDCNDDYCFNQSRVIFTPTPGASYLIRVGNWPGFGNEPGPDGKSGGFTIESQPTCILTPPPGAMIEPEPCGQSANDGCDFGAFTDIACGTTTIFGTAPVTDGVQDLDYYRIVLPTAAHLTFGGTAEFPMLLAILDQDCGHIVSWRFPSGLCDDPQLNPLEDDLAAGTYTLGVANARPVSPCGAKNNYIVTISVDTCEPSGQCCVGGDCRFITHTACTAAGGTYAGNGTTCPPPGGNYVAADCAAPVEDISATGAPGPVCDDCGQLVNLGFSFSYYGQTFTTAHVSSNGFLTFDDNFYDGALLGTTLPSPFITSVVAPWWDDFHTDGGPGHIYTQTLGTAPNRRFVALWKDVELLNFSGTTSTFEAVLFEGSNHIAFRYGAIDLSSIATVAVTSPDGSVAAVYPTPSANTCHDLTLTVAPNPCATCIADFNHVGGVTVQDIFDFLAAYFTQNPSADVNHVGGITVQDIFDFLAAYFAGC